MTVNSRFSRSTDEQIQSNEGIWAWIEEMKAEINLNTEKTRD